jgi:hypothetical protein
MKLTTTERQRFALFIHLKDAPIAGRADARHLDRIWSALMLDAIAAAVAEGRTASGQFDDLKPATFDVTIPDRDWLIGMLDRQMVGGMARLLVPVDDQLIADRDRPKDA